MNQPETQTYDLTDTQAEKLQQAGERVRQRQQQLQEAQQAQSDIYELIAEQVGAPETARTARVEDGTLHVVPVNGDLVSSETDSK